MAKIETFGFDELEEELNQLQEIPFSELFSSSFMKKCSSYASIYELIEAGGFNIDNDEDFDNIPDDELDAHIANNTTYACWEDMFEAAYDHYTSVND